MSFGETTVCLVAINCIAESMWERDFVLLGRRVAESELGQAFLFFFQELVDFEDKSHEFVGVLFYCGLFG